MTSTATRPLESFLPSGQQMRGGAYPSGTVTQIEQLSFRILRRLFAPMVPRWQMKRARRLLLESTLNAISTNDSEMRVQAAAESAMLFASALGQVMPFTDGGKEEGVDHPFRSGRPESTRPPMPPLFSGTNLQSRPAESEPKDDSTEDGGAESTEGHSDGNGVEDEPNDSDPQSRHGPVAELSPEALFSVNVLTSGTVASSASRQQQQSSPLTASQQRALDRVKAHIADTVRESMKLRVHLQLERIQSSLEPAHEVLILLSGSLHRRYPVVGPAGAVAYSDGSGAPGSTTRESPGVSRTSPRFGSAAGASPTSHCPSASSASSLNATVTGHGARTGQSSLRATVRRSSLLVPAQHGGLLPSGNAMASDVLRAPLVLGELSTLGGFPVCEELTVDSERCLIGSINKNAYCSFIASLPTGMQKRLMLSALTQRERLLPFFAPMTLGRLRLCPLLSMLSNEQLAHLKDHLMPKVLAAGMLCSERADPQHIFFIRRGLVRTEREGSANVERWGATSPKGRTVLVEGHTFGEAPCIFRESLGDSFYALSHVDAYLLPFRVLIQLMKQQPEVQSTVYSCAKAVSILREKDFEGVLRFSPGENNVYGLQGVANSRSGMFDQSGRGAHRGPTVAGSRLGSRAGSFIGDSSANVVHTVTVASPPTAAGLGGGPTISRRVTIYEAAEAMGGPDAGGGALVGGKVSPGLITAMHRIPLLSLIAPREVVEEIQRFWRCVRYEKGDVIFGRGSECNRVLLFYEGRAGLVLDENALRRELLPTPFGVADLAVLASAQAANVNNGTNAAANILQIIPQGHVVGYTCVLRHRWTRTVIALDDSVEVWEISRVSLVNVLRRHGMEKKMWAAVQQVLQPLVPQTERIHALDLQPLCHPMPNSLWGEQLLANVHPVRLGETSLFPVWREGDFPLDHAALENKSRS